MPMRGNSLVPSTVVKTLICIDGFIDYDLAGRIYNIYMPEAIRFVTILDCIRIMDHFFDDIAFPQAYFGTRTFHQNPKQKDKRQKNEEVRQYMSEDVLLNERGKNATFMVQVQFRQNATWQGTITWMDEKKTQHFRSTLEMIKLMDSALSEDAENSGTGSAGTWE